MENYYLTGISSKDVQLPGITVINVVHQKDRQLASSGDSTMSQSMNDGSKGSTAPVEDTDQTAASFNFEDYMEDENPQCEINPFDCPEQECIESSSNM
uniref:Uncharacterized protein n=1 Tax=Romanomermis culicivorax TaxID=13658 RepID=A0A915KGU6_ROMCU